VNAAREGRITKAHISRSFDHLARIKSMRRHLRLTASRRSCGCANASAIESYIAAFEMNRTQKADGRRQKREHTDFHSPFSILHIFICHLSFVIFHLSFSICHYLS